MPEIHMHVSLTDQQFNMLLSHVVGELRGQILNGGNLIQRAISTRLSNALRAAGIASDDKLIELLSNRQWKERLSRCKNVGRLTIEEVSVVYKDIIAAAESRGSAPDIV